MATDLNTLFKIPEPFRDEYLLKCQRNNARLNNIDNTPFEMANFDIDGKVWKVKGRGPGPYEIEFLSWQDLFYEDYPHNQPQTHDMGTKKTFIRVANIRKRSVVDSPDGLCCGKSDQASGYERAVVLWKASQFRQDLLSHLHTHGKQMHSVQNIVCFDLGRLEFSRHSPPQAEYRNFLRHVAAADIRNFFMEIQGGTNIPIYIYDRDYCAGCKAFLNEKYQMESNLDLVSMYKEVNEHSFVITKEPTLPIRQHVLDRTYAKHGPAGMLCDPIVLDGTENLDDPEVIRISRPADPSSPRLKAYQQMNSLFEKILDDSEAQVVLDQYSLPIEVFGQVGLYIKRPTGGFKLLDTLLKAKPLFTEELFEQCRQYSEQLNVQPPINVHIQTTDAHGMPRDAITVRGLNKQIVLPSYHQLADVPGTIQSSCDPGFEKTLIRVADKPITNPAECCRFYKNLDLFNRAARDWNNSDFCRQLVTRMREKGAEMEKVDEILCFGLGPLKLIDMDGDHTARCFLQHFTATHIRNVLQEVQGTHGVRIYAQDPLYCEECKRVLGLGGITVVETPGAFSRVTGNSFVITKSPNVAVRQIVADLADPYGGPAGMLCDPIADDGIDDPAWNQACDPSTPRLYQFQQRTKEWGMELELDDSDAVFTDDMGREVPSCVFDEVGLYLKKRA